MPYRESVLYLSLVHHGVLFGGLHGRIDTLAFLPVLDFAVLLNQLTARATEGRQAVGAAIAFHVQLSAHISTSDKLKYAGAYPTSEGGEGAVKPALGRVSYLDATKALLAPRGVAQCQ